MYHSNLCLHCHVALASSLCFIWVPFCVLVSCLFAKPSTVLIQYDLNLYLHWIYEDNFQIILHSFLPEFRTWVHLFPFSFRDLCGGFVYWGFCYCFVGNLGLFSETGSCLKHATFLPQPPECCSSQVYATTVTLFREGQYNSTHISSLSSRAAHERKAS